MNVLITGSEKPRANWLDNQLGDTSYQRRLRRTCFVIQAPGHATLLKKQSLTAAQCADE